MLDNYYTFIRYGDKLILYQYNHLGLTTKSFGLKTDSIEYAQEYIKEKGCLLLGPCLSKVKNRLKLIKYYDKPENQTRVRVYRNLHRRCFSVMQSGLVVGYSGLHPIYLKRCRPIIREGGRDKVLRTGVRNVHAFIEGDMTHIDNRCEWSYVRYSPKDMFISDNKPIDFKDRFVMVEENRIYISV
jgi:hypothetical protein